MEMLPLLQLVAGSGLLKTDAVVIAEHFRKQPSPDTAGVLALEREARYGDTVLAFYKEGDRSRESEASSQEEER
jgi:16S rRNA G966 N2-methylase RsmD